MHKIIFIPTVVLLLASAIAACINSEGNKGTTHNHSTMQNNVKSISADSSWISLFDGKSQSGWHGYNKPAGEMKNWTVEDGALVCLGAAADARGGDIVTDAEFENFELSFEWKVTKGANSGVMYHVVEDVKYKASYETGPEYQVIDDDGYPGKLNDVQKAAADYDMHAPNEKKKLMPVGQWNTARIVFNNGHAEHWLNGEKVVEFQAWDDAWKKKREESKWKNYPGYGMAKKGKIALQDHGNKVYYKNIRIREL